MKIHMSGATAFLEGNWTLSEVTKNNIDSLAVALEQIETGCAGTLQVDCRHVSAIDATGRQILEEWMRCARLRGVEPELLNLPINLRLST